MDERSFSLEAGLALDETGREILVDKPTIQRLDRLDGYDALLERSGTDLVYLCISYTEKDVYPSKSVIETDQETEQVYEKSREGFRLWLTSAPFEEDGDTVRSFCESSCVLFENEDMIIIQDMPAFAQGGERFEVRVRIRAKRTIRGAEISFEEQLTNLLYNGEEKLYGEWSGSLKETGEYVELSYLVEAFSISHGTGELYLAPYRLKVKLGDRIVFSRTAIKGEIHLSNKDTWHVLMERYYNNTMNKVLSTTSARITIAGSTIIVQMTSVWASRLGTLTSRGDVTRRVFVSRLPLNWPTRPISTSVCRNITRAMPIPCPTDMPSCATAFGPSSRFSATSIATSTCLLERVRSNVSRTDG